MLIKNETRIYAAPAVKGLKVGIYVVCQVSSLMIDNGVCKLYSVNHVHSLSFMSLCSITQRILKKN